MRLRKLFVSLAVLSCCGCHSAFVDATVTNDTTATIPLIEVDYPSASFGTQNLPAGKQFHYRFKVLGTGPVKVVYTDNSQQEKHADGPVLSEGDEGPLTVVLAPGGVRWEGHPAKR